ncbi:kinase-like protein [Gigaspora margarita]|uniref:Kinase-like protein n=1 Tax=Gigaspora margarita TaxID=4874 RepID=A0A8H4AJ65_GIGMA|nr:kinase-like protein [Gigaspora margarita]
MKLFVKELQLLQRVSFHPKVNHFYGVTKGSDGDYKMVLQFAMDGNLRDYLASKFSSLRWEDKFRIAGEIAQGLVFLHDNKIVHKNLHPKNILVHENKMMLADFAVEGTPLQYEKLYKECWDVDPDKRPEIKDAFSLLNQFILKPAEFRESIENPLKGSLKQAALDHIIKFHDYNEFNEITKIAEEPFSSIHKCEWRNRELTIVLKCLKVNDEFLDKNNVKGFIEMLQILQNFNHPNIVKFYGITKDPSSGYYSTILQWADKGDLRDYFKKEFSTLDWTRKLCMAKEISQGLCYLHNNGITHGNLHSKNILVYEERMMIGGFGISEQVNDASFSTTIARGMPAYIDPQCLKEPTHKRDKKSDIYSLGVVLWEISSGQPPFKSIEIGFSITIHVFGGGRETPVEGTPPQYEEIYKQCWDEEPIKRPDIALVLKNLRQITN